MARNHRLRLSVGPFRLALTSHGPAVFVLVVALLVFAAVALGLSSRGHPAGDAVTVPVSLNCCSASNFDPSESRKIKRLPC